jgi:hypothetical protein
MFNLRAIAGIATALGNRCGLSIATGDSPRVRKRGIRMRPIEFFTWLLPAKDAGARPIESRY